MKRLRRLWCALFGHRHEYSHTSPIGFEVHQCVRCPDKFLAVWQ